MEINNGKYRNAILFFASNVPNLGRVKLNKLLYFSDFDHFERYGEPVTGETYKNDELGPVPMHIEQIISEMESDEQAEVVAEAVIGAAGGHLFTGAVTAYAIATVHASPTIFFEAAPVETPINVLVYRGDRGVEESVQNPLITSTLVAIEHGRNIIDEHGLHVKEMNVTVLYNSGYKSGQVIHVEDALRGVTLVGKITGVSHDVRGNESLHITALDIRVPVPEGYYV